MERGEQVKAWWDRARRPGLPTARTAREWVNRLRLPGPSVLPVAGAVVGLYSGLAAGIFINLIGVVRGLTFALGQLGERQRTGAHPLTTVWDELAHAQWHPEHAI